MTEQAKAPESALQGAVRRARALVLANRMAGPNEIERANRADEPELRRRDGTLAGSVPVERQAPPVSWLEE